jgi:hypothetical protein
MSLFMLAYPGADHCQPLHPASVAVGVCDSGPSVYWQRIADRSERMKRWLGRDRTVNWCESSGEVCFLDPGGAG